MSDERAQLEAELERLRREMAQLQARLEGGPGSIAQGESATAVTATEGSIAIARVEGNVYVGPAPADESEALTIYRRVLRQTIGHLPLRGVDLGASDPTSEQRPLSLVNVYIDLDTRQQVPQAEEEQDKDRRRRPAAERESRPLTALEALAANRHLVLLGDPGSGKSTFVNYLAHCLAAHSLEPEAGWLKHLTNWPPTEAELLPLPVILRDFARSLPANLPRVDGPNYLWNFITQRLEAQRLNFAARPIEKLLEQGGLLLLLDGLDEVPSLGQRRFVRDAVAAFMARYPANRYLLTCRTLSYQPPLQRDQPDLRLPGRVPTVELAPFDEPKIDRFIAAWYAELAGQGVVPATNQADLTRQLQQAVRRPDIWRLAANPLLLTVIALVHTHKGRLPDARALLYEDTVDLLLWRWEQVKGDAPRLRQLLLEADRADTDLKRVLWQLAYDAHAQGSPTATTQSLADIDQWSLQKALAALNENDHNWARRVIETMKLRAGLLLERSPEIFTLPHRTFQEYLAGAHLAAQTDFAGQAAALAIQGALWREVILLAVGRLVYLAGDTARPLVLVSELCPGQAGADEDSWRKAWLAGEVLLEIGLKRVKDSQTGRDALARVQQRLADLVTQGRLTPRERTEAGGALAKLGDPRPEVTTVEGMQFCYVPPGPFWLGSPDGDKLAYDGEKPLHQFEIDYGYWLARYPVTVAQFSVFVEATEQRPGNEDSLRDPPNWPVRYVTWYEAMAFCRWLTETWQRQKLLPPNWQVRLPSEAEWEKAARGGLEIITGPPVLADPQGRQGFAEPAVRLRRNELPRRRYPWGDEIEPDRANYDDTQIGSPSAVGSFPAGASPYGCEEMSGNVWEWCLTKWQDNYKNYQDDNNPEGYGRRVVRGGAFVDGSRYVRCADRGRRYPDFRFTDQGFRCVVSPFFS